MKIKLFIEVLKEVNFNKNLNIIIKNKKYPAGLVYIGYPSEVEIPEDLMGCEIEKVETHWDETLVIAIKGDN